MPIEAGDAIWRIIGDLAPLKESLAGASGLVKSTMDGFMAHAQTIGAAFTVVGGAITGALGGAVNAAMDFGGAIQDAAARTGVNAEELQKLKFAAEQSGVGFETLEGAITKMNRGLGEAAATGKGPMADALNTLGISLESLQGLSPDQQFIKIADAISKVNDPATQTALAMDALGRSGAELRPMFAEGAAGIEAFGVKAQELGLIVSNDATSAAEAFGDQWDALKGQFQSIVVQVGSALMPALSSIMPVISEIVAGVANWIAANPEIVTTLGLVAGAIGSAMLALGPLIMALPGLIAGLGTLGITGTSLGAVFAALTGPIGLTAAALGVGLVLAWDYVKAAMEAAVGWVRGHWDQIMGVWNAAVGVVGAVMDVFAETLRAVFTIIGAVMDGFGAGVTSAWNEVSAGSESGSASFLDTLKKVLETVKEVVQFVSEHIGSLADWIKTHWDDIASATSIFVENFAKPLFSLVQTIASIAGEIVGWVNTIIDAINSLPEWMGGGEAPNMASPDGRALGGPVSAGVPYIVGESGEELFVPSSDGRIIPANQTRRMLDGGSGGNNITNHFNIDGSKDPRAVAEEISRELYRQQIAFGMA